jgi:hypothetical protein
MAKKVIEVQYTFTPGTRTLVINRYVRQESLMLITNVTRGTVMYNFSDSDLRATSYTAVSANTQQGLTPQTTTVVLNFNTTAMSANVFIFSASKAGFTVNPFPTTAFTFMMSNCRHTSSCISVISLIS